MDIVNFFRHIGFCCIHVELSITIHNLIYPFCVTFALGQLIWLDWSFKFWLFWDNTWNLLLFLSLAALPGAWPRDLSTARDMGSIIHSIWGSFKSFEPALCRIFFFTFQLSLSPKPCPLDRQPVRVWTADLSFIFSPWYQQGPDFSLKPSRAGTWTWYHLIFLSGDSFPVSANFYHYLCVGNFGGGGDGGSWLLCLWESWSDDRLGHHQK